MRRKIRLSVDLEPELYARIRVSAREAGQPTTVWITRAAIARLAEEAKAVSRNQKPAEETHG